MTSQHHLTSKVHTGTRPAEESGEPAGELLYSLGGRALELVQSQPPTHSGRSSRVVRGSGASSARGPIRGLSRAARWRLMRSLARINSRQVAREGFFWVTLTFPHLPEEVSEVKGALKRFRSRLERRWPGLAVVWRLEFGARPHFHLLVLRGGQRLEGFCEWCCQAWADVVGVPHACCQAERGRCWESACRYLSKLGQEHWISPTGELRVTGACWGVWNAAALPIQERRVPLTPALLERLWRSFKSYLADRGMPYAGLGLRLTLLLPAARLGAWVEKLRRGEVSLGSCHGLDQALYGRRGICGA